MNAAPPSGLTWPEFERRLSAFEMRNNTLRITQVYFDGEDAPEHFAGTWSECGISHGVPAVRLSTGETIEI